jgi:hypothetical protein
MPTAATTTKQTPTTGNPKQPAPMPMVPFTRAAKEHIEPFDDRTSAAISANTQAQGPIDVPAYGYLRNIVILVTIGTAGSGGSAVAAEDSPWSALTDIQLADVNGAPLFGPVSGYDLYLATKYGGYEFSCDPKQLSSFSAVNATTGNFAFSLKIPVEINLRDALGSLANQNASSTYKIKYTINNSAGIYTTPPVTTLPTVRVRLFLEAWAQPTSTDLRGMPQMTTPPAHGTTQYWSKFTVPVPAGSNTIRFTRVGNFIRNLILVNRRGVGAAARSNGELDWPDPVQIFWDTRLLHNYTKAVFRDVITRRTGYTAAIETAGGSDNGVFVYDWMHEFDGKLGRELRDGWLATVQSTRLEAQGLWGLGVNADTLDVITNDVSPNGEVFF